MLYLRVTLAVLLTAAACGGVSALTAAWVGPVFAGPVALGLLAWAVNERGLAAADGITEPLR